MEILQKDLWPIVLSKEESGAYRCCKEYTQALIVIIGCIIPQLFSQCVSVQKLLKLSCSFQNYLFTTVLNNFTSVYSGVALSTLVL